MTNTTNTDNNNNHNIIRNNKIIGLHVGSRVFYCNRTTLASAKGTYFAKRWGYKCNFSDDVAYVDTNGIAVFFIERDGDLFAHVLKYITTNTLNLPPFQDAKALWRDLRSEAEFFSLEGLSSLLDVTHSAFINSSVKGIFQWLGTREGPHCGYQYKGLVVDSGEIEVGRFDEKDGQLVLIPSSLSKAVLLQDRSKPVLATPDSEFSLKMTDEELRQMVLQDHLTCNLWSDAVILLTSILIRPTHISMRIHFDDLNRNNDDHFNLEASQDGVYWDLLRLTPVNDRVSSQHAGQERANFMVDMAIFVQPPGIPEETKSEHFMKAVDKLLRRTWEVEKTNEFYKFFRFVGARAGQYPDRRGGSLEMFGDVHEV